MHPNITIKVSDITTENVCAIVNAANSSLMGGGGVDGAIHRAGGFKILEACRAIRQNKYPDGLPTGEAVATTAGNMPSKYVIHTVGPIYNQCADQCQTLLEACYKNSLQTAQELGCNSIAFPAISTGIYGYPKKEAAKIAYRVVENFLKNNHDIDIRFIFHNHHDEEDFREAIKK